MKLDQAYLDVYRYKEPVKILFILSFFKRVDQVLPQICTASAEVNMKHVLKHMKYRSAVTYETLSISLGNECMAGRGNTFKPCIFPFIYRGRLVKLC